MRSATILAIAIGASVGGCGSPDVPELGYLPPSGQPVADRSAVVRQPTWLVWGNILDHLNQRGLPASELDESAGELVVSYRGDPEPYVDCGWIIAYDEDDFERTPAAAADAHFLRRHDGSVVTVARNLSLDARMTVQVEQDGESAIVRTDSVYAVTKSVAPETAAEPLHEQTVEFRSGESATFDTGTVCQSTGALERLVLDALPTLSLAGG
jgi:hypothetical protein